MARSKKKRNNAPQPPSFPREDLHLPAMRTANITDDSQGRPTLLFDLNGVLIQAKRGTNPEHDPVFVRGQLPAFVPRCGLVHLLSLRPFFRIGLYTSASFKTCKTRVECIINHLNSDPLVKAYMHETSAGARTLFPIMLTRDDCAPDTNWQQRPDWQPFDTVKPLEAHGFDLSRTIIVDDSMRKILQEELDNSILVPTLFRPNDPMYMPETDDEIVPGNDLDDQREQEDRKSLPLMRILCRLLLHHVAGQNDDVRPAIQHVRADLEQAIKFWNGSGALPSCLQHIADAPWVPGPLELPLLYPAPGPIAVLPQSQARQGGYTTRDCPPFHVLNRACFKTICEATSTVPTECVVYTGLPWFFHHSTILINLELLIDTEKSKKWKWSEGGPSVVLRPGCQHLASLLSVHRLAVFCTWAFDPARQAAQALNALLLKHVERNDALLASIRQVRGVSGPPGLMGQKLRVPDLKCVEFVLSSEVLLMSQDDKIDMPATLTAMGLPTSSTLVVNTMPGTSSSCKLYFNTEETLEVPILPSLEEQQQPSKGSVTPGKSKRGRRGRSSAQQQQQQQQEQQQATTSTAAAANPQFYNVETVTVVGRQYAMIRIICADIAAMYRDIHHHRDNGEGFKRLLPHIQAWMTAISQGESQDVERTLLRDTELDVFDVSSMVAGQKRLRHLIHQYHPQCILSKHPKVLDAIIGPPPVHRDLLIAGASENQHNAGQNDAEQLAYGDLDHAEAPVQSHVTIQYSLEADPNTRGVESDADVADDAAAEDVDDQGQVQSAGYSGLGVQAGGTKKKKGRKHRKRIERQRLNVIDELRQLSGEKGAMVAQPREPSIQTRRNRKHPNALDAAASGAFEATEQKATLRTAVSHEKHANAPVQSPEPSKAAPDDPHMLQPEENEVISIAETEDESETHNVDDASTAAATPVCSKGGVGDKEGSPRDTHVSTAPDASTLDADAGVTPTEATPAATPAEDRSPQEQTPRDSVLAPAADCSPGTCTDEENCQTPAPSVLGNTPAQPDLDPEHSAGPPLTLICSTVAQQHDQVSADDVAADFQEASGRRRSKRLRGMMNKVDDDSSTPSLATAHQTEPGVVLEAVQTQNQDTEADRMLDQAADRLLDQDHAGDAPVPAVNEADGAATTPDSQSVNTADEGADADQPDNEHAPEQQHTAQPLAGSATGEQPNDLQPKEEAVMDCNADAAMKLEPKEEPVTMNASTLSRSLSALRAQTGGRARANSLRHAFSSGVSRSLATARKGLQSIPQNAIQKAQELLGSRKTHQTPRSAPAYSADRNDLRDSYGAKASAGVATKPSAEGSRSISQTQSTRALRTEKQGRARQPLQGAARLPKASIVPETVFAGDSVYEGARDKQELSRRMHAHSAPDSSRPTRSVSHAALPQIETMVQGDTDSFPDPNSHARAESNVPARRKINPILFPDTVKPPLSKQAPSGASNRAPLRTPGLRSDDVEGEAKGRDASQHPAGDQLQVRKPLPTHLPPDLIQPAYPRSQEGAAARGEGEAGSYTAEQNGPNGQAVAAARRGWNHLPPDLLEESERAGSLKKQRTGSNSAPSENKKPMECPGGFLRRRDSEDIDNHQIAPAAAAPAAPTDSNLSGRGPGIASVSDVAGAAARSGSGKLNGEAAAMLGRGDGGFLLKRSATPPARGHSAPASATAPKPAPEAPVFVEGTAAGPYTDASAPSHFKATLAGASSDRRNTASGGAHVHGFDTQSAAAPEMDMKGSAKRAKAARSAQDKQQIPGGGGAGGRIRAPSTSPFAARILGEVGVSLRSSAPPPKSGTSPVDGASAKAPNVAEKHTEAPTDLPHAKSAPSLHTAASAPAAPQPPSSAAHDTQELRQKREGAIPGIPVRATQKKRSLQPSHSDPSAMLQHSPLPQPIPPAHSQPYNPFNPFQPGGAVPRYDAQNAQTIPASAPDKRRRVGVAADAPPDISLQPQQPNVNALPEAVPDTMHEAHSVPGGDRGRFAATGYQPPDVAAAVLKQMHDMHAVMGQPADTMPQIANDLRQGLHQRQSAQIPYTPAPVDGVRHDTGNLTAPETDAHVPDWEDTPAHAGFAGPNTVNGLAIDTNLSPLHFEVYEFARRAAPGPKHLQEVRRLLDRMNQLLRGLSSQVPGCHAVIFGSMPAGLSLPDSDIDVVLLQERPPFPPPPPAEGFTPQQKTIIGSMLSKVRNAFIRGGLFNNRDAVLIRSARVPVIRVARSRIPGSDRTIKVDISMGVSNGARAVSFVQRQVQAMPPLRPLVLVLKALLKQHNLNEARLGGLSSYCLLNMVMAHLQIQGYSASLQDHIEPVHFEVSEQLRYATHLSHACAAVSVSSGYAPGQPDLGHLLVSFLARYGSLDMFDNRAHAVSVRQGGVVPIEAVALKQNKNGQPLVVEDPQQPMHGVGASASRIGDVLRLFSDTRAKVVGAAQRWQEDRLVPVSDVPLREFCGLMDHQSLPEAPETLMLGQMLSLDCALGPSDYPYSYLRDKFSEYYHTQAQECPLQPQSHTDSPNAPDADNYEPETFNNSKPSEGGNWHGSTDPGVNLLVRGELLVRGTDVDSTGGAIEPPPISSALALQPPLPGAGHPPPPPPLPPSPPPPLPDDYEMGAAGYMNVQ